ncbi:TPA: hypothetical protein IAC10_08790 [Candidatus Scatousia excrementigallinarum]|uniref:Uncharacterized protein n=1 Tax=Candidatus Scatousia excrementigallinarum TaxID=2840935 RepID=A0A9D1JN83_9BACT|nr:hypothetical protein [Candidatus Scatousia excrementigallinarum]
MLKLFKNAFKLTNEGIILATPLILFIWLITIYLTFAKGVVDTLPEAVSAVITLLCMVGAFCAGWFYMVKESIALSKKEFILDEDRAKEILNLIKKIPAGIGKYFLSFIGMSLITLGIFAIFAICIYKLGMHFIGSIDFTAEQIKNAMSSPQDMKVFLDSLSIEQLYKLGNWNLLFMAASTLMSYMLMLWIPEIIYQTQNPLLALFKSIKKLFVKFGKSIALFVYLTLLNLVISFANTFSLLNPVIYMLMMIVYFYFLVYVIVLIFYYYDSEFNNKPEEESNSDSRSNS